MLFDSTEKRDEAASREVDVEVARQARQKKDVLACLKRVAPNASRRCLISCGITIEAIEELVQGAVNHEHPNPQIRNVRLRMTNKAVAQRLKVTDRRWQHVKTVIRIGETEADRRQEAKQQVREDALRWLSSYARLR